MKLLGTLPHIPSSALFTIKGNSKHEHRKGRRNPSCSWNYLPLETWLRYIPKGGSPVQLLAITASSGTGAAALGNQAYFVSVSPLPLGLQVNSKQTKTLESCTVTSCTVASLQGTASPLSPMVPSQYGNESPFSGTPSSKLKEWHRPWRGSSS